VAKAFVNTLKEIRNGEVLEELSTKLAGLVKAVRATGKGGSLTLKLSVSPMKRAGENTFILDDDIKVAEPQFERQGTVLYANEDNSLSRNDPRQPVLSGLRDVTKVTTMPQADGTNDKKEAVSGEA
jgi:hypothetical protein